MSLYGNGLKIKICFGKGRKNCGKRRKSWLPAYSFRTRFQEPSFSGFLTYSHTTPFDAPGKQAISPFPTVFSTHSDNFLPFSSNLKLSSANFFSLEES